MAPRGAVSMDAAHSGAMPAAVRKVAAPARIMRSTSAILDYAWAPAMAGQLSWDRRHPCRPSVAGRDAGGVGPQAAARRSSAILVNKAGYKG